MNKMLRRFYQLSFLLTGLSLATLAGAVSSPQQEVAAERTNPAAQSRAATKSTRAASTKGERPSTLVVIDAGHGGHDRGGIPGQRVAEKTMTLDVAQRLRRNLEASGYRVIMTRDSDVFVPLGTRIGIANSYRNAIFVCVHFNSARRGGANGIETYFYGRDSHSLASAVHFHVARGASSTNRGVRRRGFYVLRKARVPAVLVECGFLTNPGEAGNIQNSAYRQKLADNIAQGVRSRGNVRTSVSSLAGGDIPLQPFLDQTRVSRKRTAKRSKKRKSSKSKKKAAAQSGNVIGYYIAADNTVTAIRAEG
jgi:N-acetylmuramoyl-L-alanine amidase